jgi:glycyl-tRNA synthetase beta subunit
MRINKKQPIYVDASHDSTGGISHSSMRHDMIRKFDEAISAAKMCEMFPYTDNDDIRIAMSALTRVRNQIKDFEDRVIYITDQNEYKRLTGIG